MANKKNTVTPENKKGMPFFACEDCGTDGCCCLYGHPCGAMCCSTKPDEYMPDEDLC